MTFKLPPPSNHCIHGGIQNQIRLCSSLSLVFGEYQLPFLPRRPRKVEHEIQTGEEECHTLGMNQNLSKNKEQRKT